MTVEEYAYDRAYIARKEGRAEGLAEGLDKGVAKGREEGLSQGREEGLSQGREEGLSQGLSQGREEGAASALLSVIRNMTAANCPVEAIAQAIGKTVEETAELQKKLRAPKQD